MKRLCTKCGVEQSLQLFAVCSRNGRRRHVCRGCMALRGAQYHLERKAGRRETRGAPEKVIAPPDFKRLYSTGTRCWCCRQNSAGQMLCRSCRGAA